MRTVDFFEIIWVASCSLGLFYSIKVAVDAYKDYRAIKQQGFENGRREFARTVFLNERSTVVVQTVFVIVGLRAMTLPTVQAQAVGATIVKILFIGVAFLLTSVSIRNDRIRGMLRKTRSSDRGERS